MSKRTVEAVTTEDTAADGLWPLRSLQAVINTEAHTVTVSLFGRFKNVALYRPGLGSTLVIDTTVEELRSQAKEFYQQRKKTKRTSSPLPIGKVSEITKTDLAKVLDAAFTESNPRKLKRTRAVVVLHRGKIVAERYAGEITAETPLLGWSVAKSVVNALVGILVQQGKLSLNSKDLFEEWRNPYDSRREITINHLLQMSSGLAFSEVYANPLSDVTTMLFQQRDGAKYVTQRPAKTSPGRQFAYISGATVLLCRAIRETVGGSLTDYWLFAQQELLERIGMTSAIMEVDAAGTFVGSSFMYATARDWGRLGLLYLQDGLWETSGEKERILPSGWTNYSTTPGPKNFYGAHFWRGVPNSFTRKQRHDVDWPEGAYLAAGYQGQFVTVVPQQALVIVRLGLSVQRQSWDQVQFVKRVVDCFEPT